MQKGFKVEFDFINSLNNKTLKELPLNLQEVIKAIFENVNENSKIISWHSKYYEKADIKIKIANEVKGISIKTGCKCSMHQESLDKIIPFLEKINLGNENINIFQEYIIGKFKDTRINAVAYIEKNYDKITRLKKALDKYYIKANLIVRFIFQGTEIQKYDCDAIIHGTPSAFLWATKDEILKYLLEYQSIEKRFLNFSALHIKSYDRNLRNDRKRIKSQNDIQVKWYSITDDLKKIASLRHKCK